MVRLEKRQREETQLLIAQSRALQNISYHDLDRRQVAEELQEELEKASPKLFGGNFSFTADFVGRLKTFMSDIVEKLEQTINQNEVLRKALSGMKEAKGKVERELSQAEWKNERLETENQALKQENKTLKASKNLLDDLQEVMTDKEVDSFNHRLEDLRQTRAMSRRRQEPTKGRSI